MSSTALQITVERLNNEVRRHSSDRMVIDRLYTKDDEPCRQAGLQRRRRVYDSQPALQQLEVRAPARVQHDDLTIEDDVAGRQG